MLNVKARILLTPSHIPSLLEPTSSHPPRNFYPESHITFFPSCLLIYIESWQECLMCLSVPWQVVQWLGLGSFTARAWVQSPVRELRCHKLCVEALPLKNVLYSETCRTWFLTTNLFLRFFKVAALSGCVFIFHGCYVFWGCCAISPFSCRWIAHCL